jgi:uncharacterized protein YhaN
MRLNRLDLTRYAKFTDQSIALGRPKTGEPDLHIIYGPNEAGKSTALAAFLDLLFGIEPRSRFNFLHPYPTMKLGASLELADRPHELIRVKRPQNSLLDASEQPLSEGVILGELGGIDRDAYRTMFSLDDDTLEAGGEGILASRGDLGQLLFSASAGLAHLSHSLSDLRSEAEGFYKYRARSGALSDFKARLVTLKEDRERIDTLASQYAQLVESRDLAATQYDAAIVSRGQIQSRIDEIQRLLVALPRLAALRSLRERLAPLAALPDAPAGWVEALPKLQSDDIELATRVEGVAEEIAQLSSDLDGLVLDETAIALADRVERLADPRARHMTAEKDLPDRRLQLRETRLVISGILSRIEHSDEPDPARLVLGVSVVGALRALIETRSGVEAAAKSADDELFEARRRLEDAKPTLDEAGGRARPGQGGDAANASSLVALLAALREDDHAARSRLATRLRGGHLDTLADQVRDLRPWAGPIDELADMAVPHPSRMDSWKVAAAQAQSQIDRQSDAVTRLTTERIRLTAEIGAIGEVAGIVSDQEAGRVRAARDEAWADHRRSLDATTAEVFEGALRQDDNVASARLAHTADLAKLHHAIQAIAVLDADLARALALQNEAAAALKLIHGEMAATLRKMTPALPADLPLLEMESWLARRLRALETKAAVQSVERDLLEARTDAAAARTRLTTALVATGVAHDPEATFETLILAAQAAIDREAALKGLRDAFGQRQRDLKSREHDAERALAADQTWTAAWSEACCACWLGEAERTPSLAAVREILVIVAGLGPALEKQTGLADRISKMEKDQADFALEVAAIADELGLNTNVMGVSDLAQLIGDRDQAAKAAQTSRAEKTRNLDLARRKERSLGETLAIHAKRKAEMTTFFGVSSLAEVGLKLQDIARKVELDEQAEDAGREILEAVRTATLGEAELALDSADRATLDGELAELKGRFDDQDQRSRDMFSVHSKAIDRMEAVGGDDAVAKIDEQRRTICLEIEDGALRFLRARLGAAAAEQALRAYRNLHRSAMLARASDAFQTISRGAYTGLAAQPVNDNEVLIALGADGGSKIASELSKGTRFQLYLALRVAGYHEFARIRRPVPFLADDIMETFDDFRAEEAFRLFAEMAQVGQVIYLTHHLHLCEIAQRICPGAQAHRLG